MIDVLEVDGVMLAFGNKRVLQNVYLKSETGKITGVLGRNGAGKSSLFKIAFGELRAGSQSVRLNGIAYTSDKRSPEDIRYLPQHHFVPQQLSLTRVLNDFELSFADFLDIFPDFEQYRQGKMYTLSSGQRRIVETFIILSSNSKFCILDEPFSQIMPVHISAIKRMIMQEKKQKGIIISDHMYRHILDLSDNLYVISQGKTHLTQDISDLGALGYVRNQQKS
ncbi:MAG: ATP-binding cassette domain-containing protein [Bacteroidota bacterium]